jgi:hypothetical protein
MGLSSTRSWWLAQGLLMALVLAPAGLVHADKASAQDRAKVRCARAAELAQQLRLEAKLLEARDALRVCLRPACPEIVRSYCTRWFEEVEADLPSVVVRVQDASGNDLSDVTVSVDGVAQNTWRDGLPIALDPGEHAFVFERRGSRRLEMHVRLSTGEKKRPLAVILQSELASNPELAWASREPAVEPIATAAQPSADVLPPEPLNLKRRRVAAWVLSGVAAAGVGSFAYFGATGRRRLDELRRDCNGRCASAEVDAAWNRLIIADASLGAAVLSTGLATWLFLASRRKHGQGDDDEAQGHDPVLFVLPGRRELGLGLGARF